MDVWYCRKPSLKSNVQSGQLVPGCPGIGRHYRSASGRPSLAWRQTDESSATMCGRGLWHLVGRHDYEVAKLAILYSCQEYRDAGVGMQRDLKGFPTQRS
ncbi:hypothetical protein VTH06DRAFT_794 [Thermothelomyces fergusii]